MVLASTNTFKHYPDDVRPKLEQLRALILDVAEQLAVGPVTESVKWGEPSFSVKSGSPVRVDWKSKTPQHYYLYVNCNTCLIDTYKVLYSNLLEFQGNRAIVFQLSKPLPESVIKHCLELALTYKKRNHLPLLGT